MCGKKSKPAWLLLAVLFFWSVFSFSAFSQDANSPASDFLAAAQEIAQKHPDSKPQLLKMADALQKISDSSDNKISQLQATIDRQAVSLTDSAQTIATLKQSQTDYETSQMTEKLHLKNEISDAQTSATIGWTVAGVGWLGDIIMIVLRGLKL